MTTLDQAGRNQADSHGEMPAGGFNALVPELDVTDIGRSLAFWVDLLGFRVAYDRPEAQFAYLERDGAQIMLCQINGEWITGPLEPPLGRGVNFQIGIPDAASVVQRLDNAGWPLFRSLKEAWYRVGGQERGSLEFLVQDPDGYLVRLSQSLPERNDRAGDDHEMLSSAG